MVLRVHVEYGFGFRLEGVCLYRMYTHIYIYVYVCVYIYIYIYLFLYHAMRPSQSLSGSPQLFSKKQPLVLGTQRPSKPHLESPA